MFPVTKILFNQEGSTAHYSSDEKNINIITEEVSLEENKDNKNKNNKIEPSAKRKRGNEEVVEHLGQYDKENIIKALTDIGTGVRDAYEKMFLNMHYK